MYSYLRDLWKIPSKEITRDRLIELRKQPSIVRLEHPTRIDRARSLGYKAKQGVIIVRVKLSRGGRKRMKLKGGRRSKTSRRKKIVNKNYRRIAEERAVKKYKNLEVLNSYLLLKDGKFAWHEVILIDPSHPAIQNDKDLRWISEKQHRRRVFRGLTSAGKKSRGFLHKGKGVEKARPSLRSHDRRLH